MRKLAIGPVLLPLVLAACAQQGGQTGPGQQPNQEPTGPSQVSVIAKEYGFDLRTSPEAGRTTFVLENLGMEPHEFGLVRITGDKSVEELIELRDRADRFIEDVGSAFARPGKSDELKVTLEPGRYGYACFVTTHGQPHALAGMFGEFEVA
jgi:hypothetical protein